MILRLARDIYRQEELAASGFTCVAAADGNWLLDIGPEEGSRNLLNGMLRLPAPGPAPSREPGVVPPASAISLPTENHYRYERLFSDTWFLSSESGRWLLLSDAEFRDFRAGNAGEELAGRLAANHILLDEKNIDGYIGVLANRLGFLAEGPTLHILVVTTKCNLSCLYCQAAASKGGGAHMESGVARAAVDRIFESPSTSVIIEFQGGEPLLNFPVIREVIEYSEEKARTSGFQVAYSLISNFTDSVTYDKLAYLLQHDVSITFSLDGPEQLHNTNRGASHDNLFATVLVNVELYRRACRDVKGADSSLHALMTTTRESLPRFREIIDTYLNLGIDQISVRPLTPLGGARRLQDDIGYTPDEFLEFWKECLGYIMELRRSGRDIKEFHLELILTKLFGNESGYMDWRSPCGACYGQIVYSGDGSVFACDEARMILSDHYKIGDCGIQTLPQLLLSEKAGAIFSSSMLEMYLCDYCAYKPFCGICPVINFSEYGSVAVNVLQTRNCKIRKGMISHVLQLFLKDSKAREEFEKILLAVEWQK